MQVKQIKVPVVAEKPYKQVQEICQ